MIFWTQAQQITAPSFPTGLKICYNRSLPHSKVFVFLTAGRLSPLASLAWESEDGLNFCLL